MDQSLQEPLTAATTRGGPDHMQIVRTIVLPERCDVHTTLDLAVRAVERRGVLLLDGSQVAFIDMRTLQALVDARLDALDGGCDVIVVRPSNELRASLDLTGFDALLPIDGGHPRTDRNVPSVTLTGRLGPDRLTEIKQRLGQLTSERRPRVELRLINVDCLHLGVANVIVHARRAAQERGGDIDVIVEADSHAQRVLRSVGIVRAMRP